ncbi:MAG TPA: multiheme c-type cytochrome [Thermoanaerobaculia bacterium]|nr:multiheme c-type cytochrome [Thermoanaerobaculia bacterium]
MKRLIPGAVVALLLIASVAAQQPATTPPPAPTATPPAGTVGKYVGVASCVNSGCHGSTEPLNQTRALQNEYYTWLNNDRHAQAYNVLFNNVSARIAKNMRLRRRAYEEKMCLDCHTTNVAASQVVGNIDPEDGVQCEACHGPASGWRDEHTQLGWTHADSVRRGLNDLRDVSRRGEQCLTCHLGNASKEVDHDLIAAGHPILAFELDNYTESMPPHWTAGRESHGLRAWAVGQVVKFRDSLDNVARHARGDKWPEFADMSCYNCHHGLKASTWRQERGWPDRPGLPAWSPQHWAALRILIARISPQVRNELDPVVRDLSIAVARMNNRDAIVTSAQRARRLVEPLVARAEAISWNDADVRTMMRAIADDREFILASDVHAAEQAALSLQSLSTTLTRRDRRLLRSTMTRAIDALFEELESRDDYDPARFAQKLQAVRATL